MNSYLELARLILKASRRPMTARSILAAAYKTGIVPKHLYGKTQWKTLQARLSEDILARRDSSLFYRTEPGHFFISEFVSDPEIPDRFKERFPARRRIRDLHTEPFLAIKRDFIEAYGTSVFADWNNLADAARKSDAIRYIESYSDLGDAIPVWTFSLVRRNDLILSYRSGRYRESADNFANKRTIGFPGVIGFSDYTLFSDGDYGASQNSLSSICYDLDVSPIVFHDGHLSPPKPLMTLKINRRDDEIVLLVIMNWACPPWLEPTTKRLSINDPSWLDLHVRPNNQEDFEPWSLAVINNIPQINGTT